MIGILLRRSFISGECFDSRQESTSYRTEQYPYQQTILHIETQLVHLPLHWIKRKRTVLQLSKWHLHPLVHHHIPFFVLLRDGCCPLPEPCHTHMDPIDSFSSVDHDELLAQRTLVLVSRDDDVVHASPPNHNRNGFIGYRGNGCSGEDEVVL